MEDGYGQSKEIEYSGVLLVVWILLSSPPVNAESVHNTPEEPPIERTNYYHYAGYTSTA